MEGDAPSWILVDHLFSPSKDQLVLQVDIQHSNWINVTVEKREKEDNVPAWKTLLFHFFEGKASASADDANRTIDSVLESCRRRYGQGSPLFGNSLRLKDVSGQPQVVEAMDPSLESILRTADHLFGGEVSLPPLISRTDLQSAVIENGSFMPQTKPVWYKGEMYVAKGPASAERAYEDLSEVSNLLALPTHHPNIIPAPIALITLSRDDRRICGFLFPLYKNGNVDLYARRKRSHDQFFDRTLLKWCKQLVSAVKSLIDADTFHGDIKPDNVLISDSEDLVLIDLARSFTTMAIASPEVKQIVFRTGRVQVPSDWPIQEIEKSEVYSIGRTMFFLGEGVSMSDIYLNLGPENGKYPTKFHSHSSTPDWLQPIILSSVQEDPLARPSLHEVAVRLDLAGS